MNELPVLHDLMPMLPERDGGRRSVKCRRVFINSGTASPEGRPFPYMAGRETSAGRRGSPVRCRGRSRHRGGSGNGAESCSSARESSSTIAGCSPNGPGAHRPAEKRQ